MALFTRKITAAGSDDLVEKDLSPQQYMDLVNKEKQYDTINTRGMFDNFFLASRALLDKQNQQKIEEILITFMEYIATKKGISFEVFHEELDKVINQIKNIDPDYFADAFKRRQLASGILRVIGDPEKFLSTDIDKSLKSIFTVVIGTENDLYKFLQFCEQFIISYQQDSRRLQRFLDDLPLEYKLDHDKIDDWYTLVVPIGSTYMKWRDVNPETIDVVVKQKFIENAREVYKELESDLNKIKDAHYEYGDIFGDPNQQFKGVITPR